MPPTPTILLVEDEPIIAEMYQAVLGTRPYRVILALNKQRAIELIEGEKPGLILLDLMIPIGAGEDLITYDHPVGFDILEWVNDHPDLAHTKVMVLTNLESTAHREHAERLGVTDYLVKAEHDPHDILRRVDAIVGRPS
ncbi:MAG: response regulator [Candidatus Kerfeldbacteria bacterium]|nr:response regulator [Candidatus Kerfeldbacteria bacterium]